MERKLLVILVMVGIVSGWTFDQSFNASSPNKIYCLDFSPSGQHLAIGSQTSKVTIFETTGWTIVDCYNCPEIPRALKYSNDGDMLAIGFDIDNMDILQTSDYSLAKRLSTGHSKVHDIDFLEDSSRMITCGDDKKFRVWNPTSSWSQTHSSSDLGQVIWQCRYAHDGRIALGMDDGQVKLYSSTFSNTDNWSPDASGKAYGVDFKYGTNNEFIMGSDNQNGYTYASSTRIIDTGEIIWFAKYARTNEYFMFGGEDFKVHVIDPDTNSRTDLLTGPTGKVYCGDFTNDGCTIAVGSEDFKVYVWHNDAGSCAPSSGSSNSSSNSSNSSACSLVDANIQGCSVCSDTSTCIECSVGYYLDSDACSTCVQAMQGCGVCSSSSVCLYCLPGFYQDSNSCSACSSTMDGCISCSDSSTCLQCHSDYYLNGNTCDSCTDVTNCLKCTSSSVCTQCLIGFYVDGSDDCQACGSQCFACQSSTNCTACLPGYYSNGGTCTACSSGCLSCDENGDCLQCSLGTYESGGSCTSCPAPCVGCSDASTCTTCAHGYESGGSCVACSTGCSSCTDGSTCTSCHATHTLQGGSSCVLCQAQIAGCVTCSDTSTCTSCLSGYYLSGASCSSCESSIDGCIVCEDSSTCVQCKDGYYENAGSCTPCENTLTGCLSCTDSSTCATCRSGYYQTGGTCSLCENSVSGCVFCSDASTCLLCKHGHTLNGGACDAASAQSSDPVYCDLSFCIVCTYDNGTDSNNCTQCLPTHYLDGNGDCVSCSSMDGCRECSSSGGCDVCEEGYYPTGSGCELCSESIFGCQKCSSAATCIECSGAYYENAGSCVGCDSSVAGCLSCSDSSTCVSCLTGYYVSGGSCASCESAIDGCIVCSDSSTCQSCKAGSYQSAGSCIQCGSTIAGCLSCSDSSTCASCSSGYYVDGGSCVLCEDTLNNCIFCSDDASLCLQCKNGHYLSSFQECESCSSIAGCSQCVDDTTCSVCLGGYYLTAGACEPCTTLPGCSFCDSTTSNCLSCKVSYYLEMGACTACSSIPNCFHCSDQATCILCNSGYELLEGACALPVEQEVVPTQTEDQVVEMSLTLKTYYVDEQNLKHVLIVKGTTFTHAELNLQQGTHMYIEDNKGNNVSLQIKEIEWGNDDVSLIFYTNNPYDVEFTDMKKMNFTRRLLTGEILNYKVELQMNSDTIDKVLPKYTHSGDLRLDYSLDKPEFVATVVKSVNSYWYHLFGVIVVCVLFLSYLMKASCTVPTSEDQGQIIPHILALKAGVLILYPTYIEYYDYCSGYMVGDLPWANAQIGPVLGSFSDTSPFPYSFFYTNMNFGSMYIIPFSVILVLAFLFWAICKKISDSKRMTSLFAFLYSFFVFGLCFAGCASLQGAIENPLNEIDLNAFFYLLGMFIYFGLFLYSFYSLKSSVKNMWKIRVFIKATALSLSHLNPVYLVSVLLFLDIALIIHEYIHVKTKPKVGFTCQYPKLWLVNNILCDVALGILVLLPIILLSLLIVSILIGYVIISDAFMHFRQIKAKMKVDEDAKGSTVSEKQHGDSNMHLDNIFDPQNSSPNRKSNSIQNMSNILATEEPCILEEEVTGVQFYSKHNRSKKKRRTKKDAQDNSDQGDIVFIYNEEIQEKKI